MSVNQFLRDLSGTESVYWHDSGKRSEVEEAISNGAVSITLNPFLTASALEADQEYWQEKASAVAASYSGDKKAEELTKLVAGGYAERLRGFYQSGKPGAGYVCAQVNPSRCGDAEAMIEQAKSYASAGENVCVKLPATRAGLIACEECAALGLNVVMTVGMTVPQAVCSGEALTRGHKRALQNGIKPGFGAAVIMVGRLDDYLRDVARDNGADITEEEIVLAGVACYKRSIEIFREKHYDAFLMAAAFRGVPQLKELAGSRTMLSVAPKIAGLVAGDRMTENISGRPVNEKVIAHLSALKEFEKAYDPDGMKPEEFITFGAVNRTIAQFTETGWNKLKAFRC